MLTTLTMCIAAFTCNQAEGGRQTGCHCRRNLQPGVVPKYKGGHGYTEYRSMFPFALRYLGKSESYGHIHRYDNPIKYDSVYLLYSVCCKQYDIEIYCHICMVLCLPFCWTTWMDLLMTFLCITYPPLHIQFIIKQ